MTIEATDITFTYSGGDTNTDPEDSLGGETSAHTITNQRLFPDVTPDQSVSGLIDYRCFYLHNENIFDSLYEAEVLIAFDIPGSVSSQMGVYSSNERQNITVLNHTSVVSGTFTLTYTDVDGDHNFTVDWDADMAVVANNIEDEIREINNLEDVTVTANVGVSSVTFEVDFVGSAEHRFHDLLAVDSNDLSPAESIATTRAVSGGPINSVATEIDAGTTVPVGVTFFAYQVPYSVGELRALDSIPIWIKRTVTAGATAMENDGFTFRLAGNPIE